MANIPEHFAKKLGAKLENARINGGWCVTMPNGEKVATKLTMAACARAMGISTVSLRQYERGRLTIQAFNLCSNFYGLGERLYLNEPGELIHKTPD